MLGAKFDFTGDETLEHKSDEYLNTSKGKHMHLLQKSTAAP